ncbi:Probable non-ribosomal peptide synthetase [Mycobacteroides abscessus subsp. massiliense]|nr:Probable non-ribosomal peptide synthetase [Mycobacteroides abscessus subsp. massiliense]
MLESEGRALPLSRGQLDIWLSQETGLSNDQNLWMSLGGWRRKGRTFPRMI